MIFRKQEKLILEKGRGNFKQDRKIKVRMRIEQQIYKKICLEKEKCLRKKFYLIKVIVWNVVLKYCWKQLERLVKNKEKMK